MTTTEIFVSLLDQIDLIFTVSSEVHPAAGSRRLHIDWTKGPIAALELGPADGVPIVANAGDELYKCLRAHPNIDLTIPVTIASANSGAAIRIFVEELATEGHRVPWETMRSATGFVSRFSRVPVVRIAGSNAQRKTDVMVRRELKIVVILGALGVNCRLEWEQMYAALRAWPFSIDATFLVYDVALSDEINGLSEGQPGGRALASGETHRMRAKLIPSRPDQLMDVISECAPHICHFFCHGTSDTNGQLEIGHRGAALAGAPPLFLGRHNLASLAKSAWLVVLNACQSATPVQPPAGNPLPGPAGPTLASATRVGSFASELVANGVPFVVGMRDKIASNIVPHFTREFYREALRLIADSVKGAGQSKLDLSPAVIKGQDAICEHFGDPALASERQPDWTFPIVFTRRDPFIVSGSVDPAINDARAVALQGEIKELKSYLDGGIDPGIRGKIEDRISALEKQLGLQPSAPPAPAPT